MYLYIYDLKTNQINIYNYPTTLMVIRIHEMRFFCFG